MNDPWPSPSTTALPRWIVLVLFVTYIISPIDLIPDAILIIGWLDDAVALVLAWRTWRDRSLHAPRIR